MIRINEKYQRKSYGYEVEPPDIQRRFIAEFRWFRDVLMLSRPRKWFCRVHAVGFASLYKLSSAHLFPPLSVWLHPSLGRRSPPTPGDGTYTNTFTYRFISFCNMLLYKTCYGDVGLRLANERDRGETIFVDIPKRVLKIRGFFYRRPIVISLSDSEIRYIVDRIGEGGRLKMARIWIDDHHLYVGLVFERNAEPRNCTNAVVIDVNSWRHGVAYSVITTRTRDPRIVVERPDTRYIENIYSHVLALEKKCGVLKRLGLKHSEEYRKARKEATQCRSKIYRYLKDFCNKLVHKIVELALKTNSRIVVDYVREESRRELLEEGLPSGLAKIYMAYIQRLVNLLKSQCQWYGIPFELKRLPSSICPICRSELVEAENRTMICNRCGFREKRDKIPILHYHIRLSK